MPAGGTRHHVRATIDSSVPAIGPDLPPGDYVQLSRHGHRHRHRPRRARKGDGALLHDQGARQGQRPWPQHGLRLRQAVERCVPDPERAWHGHDGGAVAAACARGHADGSAPPKEEPRAQIVPQAAHPARRRPCGSAKHDGRGAGGSWAQRGRSRERRRRTEGPQRRRLRLRRHDQRLCDAASVGHGVPACRPEALPRGPRR